MGKRRFITEIGMGVDQHGQDVTHAARKAVLDAISRNYLIGLREVAPLASPNEMLVDVLVGAPFPELVDENAVLSALPYGKKTIRIVKGGLVADGGLPLADKGDKNGEIMIALAAVTVSVPD
jgi:uncharacterized protein (TIGR02058 family)